MHMHIRYLHVCATFGTCTTFGAHFLTILLRALKGVAVYAYPLNTTEEGSSAQSEPSGCHASSDRARSGPRRPGRGQELVGCFSAGCVGAHGAGRPSCSRQVARAQTKGREQLRPGRPSRRGDAARQVLMREHRAVSAWLRELLHPAPDQERPLHALQANGRHQQNVRTWPGLWLHVDKGGTPHAFRRSFGAGGLGVRPLDGAARSRARRLPGRPARGVPHGSLL